MDQSPQSYRVPVLRLSDVVDDSGEVTSTEQQATPSQPTQAAPAVVVPVPEPVAPPTDTGNALVATPQAGVAQIASTVQDITQTVSTVKPPPTNGSHPVQSSPVPTIPSDTELVPKESPAIVAPENMVAIFEDTSKPPVGATEEGVRVLRGDSTPPPAPTSTPEQRTQPTTIGFDLPDMWEQAAVRATPATSTEPLVKPILEAPIQEIPSSPQAFIGNTLPQQEDVSTKEQASKKAAVSGANLAALRERILQQSVAANPTTSSGTPATPDQPTTSTPSPKQQDAPARTTLEGVHATAIADIARSLQTGSVGATPVERGTDTVPQQTQRTSANIVSSDPSAHGNVSTIRTLKTDVEQMVTHNKTSVVDMISAEEVRRGKAIVRTAPQSRLTSSSYVLLGASLALLVGAVLVGLLYFVFRTVEPEEQVEGFFFPEQTEVYEIGGKDRSQILNDLVSIRERLEMRNGFVAEVRLEKTILLPTTKVSETHSIAPSTFLTSIDAHAPSSLERSLDDRMMLGFYRTDNTQPFIIFTVKNYENAFSGMLAWEETIAKDLTPLFNITYTKQPPLPESATSTTSTSTQLSTETQDSIGTFEDRTISNVRVRALPGTPGNNTILWSMPDNSTIIIAASEEVMINVRGRMTARQY